MHRLPKHAYIVLDDLMLLSEVGLTQIDHVVVSVYGIFVIETKNYSGRITGTPRADFWIQFLSKSVPAKLCAYLCPAIDFRPAGTGCLCFHCGICGFRRTGDTDGRGIGTLYHLEKANSRLSGSPIFMGNRTGHGRNNFALQSGFQGRKKAAPGTN